MLKNQKIINPDISINEKAEIKYPYMRLCYSILNKEYDQINVLNKKSDRVHKNWKELNKLLF